MTSVPLSRACALAILAFALGGCGLLPSKEPLSLYAPTVKVAPRPDWPAVTWQLQISRPHADELLDSPRIVVRPRPGALEVYKGAVWSAPPPDLLQDAVLHALEDSGRIPGVARRGAGIAGDYELVLDLRHFESDYGGGTLPQARVEVAAKLIAARSNQVVASRTFAAARAAPATDVGAVATAFDAALAEVVGALAGWTLAEGQRHDAAHPRPPR